jgi:hypothetical protein
MYYEDNFCIEENAWSGTNGYGEVIYNPEAYYKAVNEDRYGFNSDYAEDQRDKFHENY